MKLSHLFWVAVLGSLFCACSGGGSSGPTTAVQGWEKFRHDPNNTGLGNGSVSTNNAIVHSLQVDPGAPSAISSSPAISADDSTVYVASEAGTVAAVPRALGTARWTVTSCSVCPQGQQALGTIVSSPAVYTLTNQPDIPLNDQTTIFVASTNGSVFTFQDAGGSNVSCTGCFQPNPGGGAVVRFLSSPSFTTDPVVTTVNGVFIGARLEYPDGHSAGKLYAINRDGSLNWEFPRPGDPAIGAVTSSPALGGSANTTTGTSPGTGNTWYFTAADNFVYALAGDGSFKWKVPVGTVVDPAVPLAISPLTTSSAVLAPTADGQIVALNLDGSPLWNSLPASAFASSLALGGVAAITPTGAPAPTVTPTPQPAKTGTQTPTPTGTPTLVPESFVYAITKTGEIVQLNLRMPTPTVVPAGVTIALPVLSSPALSADGYLVFGTADGTLHAINTVTGTEPTGWPVKLTASPIRSSPALSNDGIVYVGADDGKLYVVGLK